MNDSVIVLCGGRSTRMGRDKAALPFGAETLLARVVRTARMIADDVVVVGEPHQQMPPRVRVVRDAVEGLGPLAGLSTGLAAVDGDRALLLACDMPLLRPALLRGLLALAGDHDASVPLVDGVPMTTCAVYATRVGSRSQALVANGTRSLRALLDEVSVQWVSDGQLRGLDPDLVSFWDCDTPERYRAALRRAGLDQPLTL